MILNLPDNITFVRKKNYLQARCNFLSGNLGIKQNKVDGIFWKIQRFSDVSKSKSIKIIGQVQRFSLFQKRKLKCLVKLITCKTQAQNKKRRRAFYCFKVPALNLINEMEASVLETKEDALAKLFR